MEQGPPDAIFGLVEAHKKDPRPEKVSLAIGAYRDSEGKPLVLPTVRKVGVAVWRVQVLACSNKCEAGDLEYRAGNRHT